MGAVEESLHSHARFLRALPMGPGCEEHRALKKFGHYQTRLSWNCTNVALDRGVEGNSFAVDVVYGKARANNLF